MLVDMDGVSVAIVEGGAITVGWVRKIKTGQGV
jgi:hypothetical protein